jgi:hypothetical protein
LGQERQRLDVNVEPVRESLSKCGSVDRGSEPRAIHDEVDYLCSGTVSTGFQLAVDLDALCGETFTFRELIECGETWERFNSLGTPIDNLPRDPATLEAMRILATSVLDPVARTFGRPLLTYAFASRPLTRHIQRGISPSLDQHAGHERTRAGKLVCPRAGFAVDMRILGVSAPDLASYIWNELPFDRMYLYGSLHPVHVSTSASPVHQVVCMRPHGGRRIPVVVPDVRDLERLLRGE